MNDKLVQDLVSNLMRFKKAQIKNIITNKNLTHNESLILFILHDLSKIEKKVPLSLLRDKMMLAPSTITPIITSLENAKLIKRFIDKEDRRNIFIEITNKGKIHTSDTFKEISKNICEYINYMGEEDTKEIIRLVSKTTDYFEERKEVK